MPRSELLSITEKDRLKEDKEVFFEIKDRLELNHEYKCLDLSCYSCGKSDHLISDCPFIHYVIKPEELLKKNKKRDDLFKKVFKRFKRKHFNSLANILLIQSTAYALMNVYLICKEEGLEDFQNKRIDLRSNEDLDENQEGIGLSFMNFKKNKEEQDFDKLVKLKNDNEVPFIHLSLRRNQTEPYVNFCVSPKGNSPRTNKSKISRRSQNLQICNFSEASGLIEPIQSNMTKVQKKMKRKI